MVFDERDAVLREADIEIATREQFPGWLAMATALRGWARVLEGDHAALDEVKRGVASWTARGVVIMRPFLLAPLADAARAAGDPGTGLQAIDEGLHEGMGNERWAEPELHRCRAELLLCCGDRAGAQRSAREAVTVARRTAAAGWEPRAAATLARVGEMSGVVL